MAGIFAGQFNFRAVTPYSASRLLDLILDIYEARIVEMRKKKEKHKLMLLKSLSSHKIMVIDEMEDFQDFIVG